MEILSSKISTRLQLLTKSANVTPSIKHIVDAYLNSIQQKIGLLGSITPEQKSNVNKTIFANNYFNFGEVKVVGFDLDYTLLSYSTELQKIIYSHARDTLTDTYGFPKELKSLEFDSGFAIRGLSVDTKNGTLCKLSHSQKVGLNFAFKGKNPLSVADIELIYGDSRHISFEMRPLYDMYSIVEACLIADAMDVFATTAAGDPTAMYPDPAAITDDVQAAVRDVHVSGFMHLAIMQDLERYLIPSPQLEEMLVHLKEGGKKLFLCTNSGFKYTNRTLSHALRNRENWRSLFDQVICSAHKPDFYSSKRPFRRWNIHNESPSTTSVGHLENGEVYVHGSAHALKRATGWLGREILYLGDNLLTDLKEARRMHGWHTGCVLSELDHEIEVQSSSVFDCLHFLRSSTRQLVTQLQRQMEEEAKAAGTRSGKRFKEEDRELLKCIEHDLQEINFELSALFNKQFGSVFRSHGHLSLFASTVRQYADIYMSDITHLLHYNPEHRFYPNNPNYMAHDIIRQFHS